MSTLARTTPGRSPRSATASRSAFWKSGGSGPTWTANNYPSVLQGLLQRLDPAWRVINRGRGGEVVQDGASRISDVLRSDRPGFILIMEGTNNASRCDDPAFIAGRLQTMVQRAKANRTVPLLGTIPQNFRNDPCARDVIDGANGLIRGLASAEGIVLADIFNGMNDRNLFALAPEDPFHPNEQGYRVMANIWLNALRQAIPARSVARGTEPPQSAGRSDREPAASTGRRSDRSWRGVDRPPPTGGSPASRCRCLVLTVRSKASVCPVLQAITWFSSQTASAQ